MVLRIVLVAIALSAGVGVGRASSEVAVDSWLLPSQHFYVNGERLQRIRVLYDSSSDELRIDGTTVLLGASGGRSPEVNIDPAEAQRLRQRTVELYRDVPYVKARAEEAPSAKNSAVDECINLEQEISRLFLRAVNNGSRAVDQIALRDSILNDSIAREVVDRIEVDEVGISLYFYSGKGHPRMIDRAPSPRGDMPGRSRNGGTLRILQLFASLNDGNPTVLIAGDAGVSVFAGGAAAQEIVAQVEHVLDTGVYVQGRCSEAELRAFLGK